MVSKENRESLGKENLAIKPIKGGAKEVYKSEPDQLLPGTISDLQIVFFFNLCIILLILH